MPFLGDYDAFKKDLDALAGLRCRGCRDGGGNPFCKIRKCCQKKGIEGCWECDEFEGCDKSDFLRPVHGDAHIKNLRALKRKGTKGFVKGKTYWYSPEKKKGGRGQ